MDRPVYDMLSNASGRLSLHMPGAQGQAPFGEINPYRLDTTELGVTDDLYRPTGAITRAQALAAKSAGAAHTLLLHGGSTAGIHAMLLYAAVRGDKVILPRNAHISAVHLCALAGLEPVFAEPSYTPGGRPYTTVESYLRTMDEHPDAKAVLTVRPDFYGIQCDLKAIAAAAHQRGMLALCDEAHGAHFNWDEAAHNAMACGADMAVQSAHKTLPALTAGAWLHGAAAIDIDRLRRLLRMVQTSSPSFINMLSLDDARAWMDINGQERCRRLKQAMAAFKRRAAALGYKDGQADFLAWMERDLLRLVLDAPQGGFALGDALAAKGIDVEMCDAAGVVCILSLQDGEARLERLYQALAAMGEASAGSAGIESPTQPYTTPRQISPPEIPPRAMPLAEAAFARCEAVPAGQAVGRVSAGQVGLYPPGVALLAGGEVVTEDVVKYLAAVGREHLFGVNADGSLNCVKERKHE